MTLLLWILPAAIVAVGFFPLFAAFRALADEAAALRGELRRAGALRPALVDTRIEVGRLRSQLRRSSSDTR